ncbi:hypothetical protein GII23_02720 [Stutzerimonas balearica]|nr:hypothetical protein [Stutzerimonas stutzeri]MBK3853410.1 hypothetical protein [Stutzerimonas stutzeri]QIJ02529.1 hypothetical protein GII23_02720 [Stutzerimonas balearica]
MDAKSTCIRPRSGNCCGEPRPVEWHRL